MGEINKWQYVQCAQTGDGKIGDRFAVQGKKREKKTADNSRIFRMEKMILCIKMPLNAVCCVVCYTSSFVVRRELLKMPWSVVIIPSIAVCCCCDCIAVVFGHIQIEISHTHVHCAYMM